MLKRANFSPARRLSSWGLRFRRRERFALQDDKCAQRRAHEGCFFEQSLEFAIDLPGICPAIARIVLSFHLFRGEVSRRSRPRFFYFAATRARLRRSAATAIAENFAPLPLRSWAFAFPSPADFQHSIVCPIMRLSSDASMRASSSP